MKFIPLKPSSIAKHLVAMSVSLSLLFWNTVVSCFAEGLLGSTHQHNTYEWWKKQKWAEEEAESQCNCDRGPGQSYREFWGWNGPLECSQLGLGGQTFVPTLRPIIRCKLLTQRSRSFGQGYSISCRQYLVMNTAVSSWGNEHLGLKTDLAGALQHLRCILAEVLPLNQHLLLERGHVRVYLD